MRLKVLAAERLVQVLKEHRARADHHVNEAILDDVCEQTPHTRRYERAVGGDDDGRVVAEHVEPDAVRLRELARAEARALHLLEQPRDGAVAVYLHGPDGRGEILRCSRFTLSNHFRSFGEWRTANGEWWLTDARLGLKPAGRVEGQNHLPFTIDHSPPTAFVFRLAAVDGEVRVGVDARLVELDHLG